MKAEASHSQGRQQSFVSTTTEDIKYISPHSRSRIMLTEIVDLTNCFNQCINEQQTKYLPNVDKLQRFLN